MGSQLNLSRNSRKKRMLPKSEVNVTPLVDVMLVLLIIFMVTAPILTVNVPVNLPKTDTTPSQALEDPKTMVISIDGEGKTYLKDTPMPLGMIIDTLQKDPEFKIYVRGDESLSYGKIMAMMGTLSAAGLQKVALMAEVSPPQKNNIVSNKKDTS